MDGVGTRHPLRTRLLGRIVSAAAVLLVGVPAGALAAPPKIGGIVPLTGTGACVTSSPTTGCGTDTRLNSAIHVALSTSGNAICARLTSISGTAGPAGGVQSVSVGILRLANGAHVARARPACLYLGSNGRLRRTTAGKRHTCTATHLLRAGGTLHWVLRLRHHLPRGTYIVYSQAVGRNGKRETIRLSGGANVARVKVR